MVAMCGTCAVCWVAKKVVIASDTVLLVHGSSLAQIPHQKGPEIPVQQPHVYQPCKWCQLLKKHLHKAIFTLTLTPNRFAVLACHTARPTHRDNTQLEGIGMLPMLDDCALK